MAKNKIGGSYEKRGEDSWRLVVSGGSDPATGKRIKYQKTIKAPDEKTVKKELAKFIALIDSGKYRPASSMRLEDFIIDCWWPDHVKVNLRPRTQENYKVLTNSRIIPQLGKLRLDKIKPPQLLSFYSSLREEGSRLDKKGSVSAASVMKYHHILSSILNCAVTWGYIDENPASRVKPGVSPKPKTFTLDEEEIQRFLFGLPKEKLKYQLLSLIGIFTGLRRGEALALMWSDIDMEKKVFDIRYSSHLVSGREVFLSEPKTRAGIRIVPFPEFLIPMLKAYQQEQRKERIKSPYWVGSIFIDGKEVKNELLFTQSNGKPMHPNTVNNWMRKYKAKHNLPKELTFHGLRHTAATMMIIQGNDIGTVSKNLGHSRPSVTTDIYYASLMSAQRAAADSVNRAYQGTIKQIFDKETS